MDITEKEKAVLILVADGKTNEEIGLTMNIKPTTVNQYIRILMFKIPSMNRAQLASEAIRKGLIK